MKRRKIGELISMRRNSAVEAMQAASARAHVGVIHALRRLRVDESGQGTTEYAILVGVLAVIAILAITMFRPKIQELWDAIANGINGL